MSILDFARWLIQGKPLGLVVEIHHLWGGSGIWTGISRGLMVMSDVATECADYKEFEDWKKEELVNMCTGSLQLSVDRLNHCWRTWKQILQQPFAIVILRIIKGMLIKLSGKVIWSISTLKTRLQMMSLIPKVMYIICFVIVDFREIYL